MPVQRVLIVEDEILLAIEVEAALKAAGYDVCGVATSEAEALAMARDIHPDLAVVDVRLAPGNGKHVAHELAVQFNTTILMATSENPDHLDGIGASGVIPKPYDAEVVPAALAAAETISQGGDPGRLPDHMKRLDRS